MRFACCCWSVTESGLFLYFQVMETERMIYLVTEYASGGEIFGKKLLSSLFVVTLFSVKSVSKRDSQPVVAIYLICCDKNTNL